LSLIVQEALDLMRKTILRPNAVTVDGAVNLSWMKSTPLFSSGEQQEFAEFRILRREEPFVFGEDYEEFFLNVARSGAELIFQGAVECQGDRRFSLVDDAVKTGVTYSYWIQTATSEPVGPVPVRVRDPEVWWTYQRLAQELSRLKQIAPGQVELSTCGRTAGGAEIPLLHVGSGPRRVGLVGTIHAGESGPELIVPVLQQLALEQPELLAAVQVIAVPSVAMDERERMVRGVPWYLRTNAQGVDLNRNFPASWDEIEYGYGLDSSDPTSGTYRGPEPASAPETRGVMDALTDESLDLVLSYHCLASICGLPALTARAAEGCDSYVQRCRDIIGILAQGMYPERPAAGQALSFGCSAGSLPTWLFQRGRVPAFDLEGGTDPDALAQCRYDGTDIELLQDYRKRHYAALLGLIQSLANGEL
jgi:hypothetical protein